MEKNYSFQVEQDDPIDATQPKETHEGSDIRLISEYYKESNSNLTRPNFPNTQNYNLNFSNMNLETKIKQNGFFSPKPQKQIQYLIPCDNIYQTFEQDSEHINNEYPKGISSTSINFHEAKINKSIQNSIKMSQNSIKKVDEDSRQKNKKMVIKTMNQDEMDSTLFSIKKCLSNRQSSKLDQPVRFDVDTHDHHGDHDEILTTKSAVKNQLSYLENFVPFIEVPSLYVIDSKINKKFQQYSVQLIKYVFPTQNPDPAKQQFIVNHFMDGKINMMKMEESKICRKFHDQIVLRGLKRTGCQLQLQMRIVLHDVKEAQIVFSDDGNMLALFSKDIVGASKVRIFKMKNDQSMQNLFDLIENDLFFCEFVDQEFSQIDKLKFDNNNQFIIGYGSSMIIIYPIEQNGQLQMIKLDENQFGQILDLSFSSSGAANQCYVACNIGKEKKIQIFDILKKDQKVINFYYEFEITDQAIVKISDDFKSFIFTDVKEKFLIEIRDSYYCQINLEHLDGKYVNRIGRSAEGERGFYLVAASEYSKTLQLYHTHEYKALVKFDRDVQPGLIKVMDMKILTSEGKDGFTVKTVRIHGMRDDEFVFDKAVFEEKEKDNIEDINMEHQYKTFTRRNVVINEYMYSAFTAYSVNWPFIAFSGFNNNIIVINAFEKQLYHRIQFALEGVENVKVMKTYITDTYDLFLVTQTDEVDIVKFKKGDGKSNWNGLNKRIAQEDDTIKEQLDNNGAEYKLFQVDLMPLQDKKFQWRESILKLGEPIFQYTEVDVDHEQLLNIHVRSSSSKLQDRNQKLIVFFQHKKHIYSWIQKSSLSKDSKIRKLSECSSNEMPPVNDQAFLFLRNVYKHSEPQGNIEDNKVVAQEVIRINIQFSSFEIQSILKDANMDEKIKTINVDQNLGYLMIFSKEISIGEESGLKIYRFKIFDINKRKTIYKSQIKNNLLVGILKSGLYTYVQGHIYYNNNCIKIRYDLLGKDGHQNLKENEIFDYYVDIIPLNDGMRMQSNSPLDSIKQHRMVYINQDTKQLMPQILQFFPYPHERKIYLVQKQMNHEYFFTSIVTSEKDEKKYIEKILQEEMCLIDNKCLEQSQYVKDRLKKTDVTGSFTSIICLDTNIKYQKVFNQAGLLINSFDYSELVRRYGNPVATSSNGYCFVFRKTIQDLLNEDSNISENEIIKQTIQLHIIQMSAFGMAFIKTIDVWEQLKDFEKELQQKHCWFKNLTLEHLQEDLFNLNIVINDHLDVCVRIKLHKIRKNKGFKRSQTIKNELMNLKSKEQTVKKKIEGNDHDQIKKIDEIWGSRNYEENFTFYLLNKGYDSLDIDQLTSPLIPQSFIGGLKDRKNKDQNLSLKSQLNFHTQFHANVNFNLSKERIYFWSIESIVYFDIGQPWELGYRKKLNYELPQTKCQQTQTVIRQILLNSDPNMILIKIEQSTGTSALIGWDFSQNNIVRELFGLQLNPRVLYDYYGNPYVLNNNNLNMVKLRASFLCYDTEDYGHDDQTTQEVAFGKDRGHKFDYLNHNWLILGQYLALSFSYMSFVIKDKIEKKDEAQKGNYFDLEPYNYVFNKCTAFTDGMFVAEDHEQLTRVLSNFMKIDERLMSSLVYKQIIHMTSTVTKHNTVLHLALESGNNRSVEVLLQFFSMVKFDTSVNFVSIIDKLILFQNFKPFIQNLEFQTPFMLSKQQIKIKDNYSDKIVMMCLTNSVVIDDEFIKNNMHDDVGTSFPVKIIGVRLEWIIKEPEGHTFLKTIYESEDMDLYSIPTLQCIIEYLYYQFKSVLLYIVIPQFLSQVIIFHTIGFLFEKQIANMNLDDLGETIHDEHTSLESIQDLSQNKKWYSFYKVMIIVFSILNLIPLFMTIHSRFTHFRYHIRSSMSHSELIRNKNIWLDFLYVVDQMAISWIQLTRLAFESAEEQIENWERDCKMVRYFEVFGLVLIYIKFSYFMSLDDDLAPLMDIVFKIFQDMKYFILIMLIYSAGISSCFWLIGQNQIEFDEISPEKMSKIGVPYSTITGSMWYTFDNFILGNGNTNPYKIGDNSQKWILFPMAIISSFLMLIHLLNMLIAIMGNTFAERSQVAEEIKSKDHLVFVLDNWHLLDKAFTNMQDARYIISAMYADLDIPDDQKVLDEINEVKQSNTQLKQMIADLTKEFLKSNQDNKILISNLSSQQSNALQTNPSKFLNQGIRDYGS